MSLQAVITKPWTKQPPRGVKLDRSHPISKKIGFVWSGPHTGGSWGIDHVSGREGLLTATGSVPSKGVAVDGQHISQINNLSTQRSIYFYPIELVAEDGVTLLTVHRHTDFSQDYNCSMSAYDGTGAAELDWIFGLYPIDATTNQGGTYSGIAANYTFWSTGFPAAGNNQWVSFGAHRPWGTSQASLGWLNGNPIGANSGSAGTMNQVTTQEIHLMGNQTYPSEALGGDLVFAAAFTQVPTDEEWKALHENPWQIFEPRKIFVPPKPNRRVVTF